MSLASLFRRNDRRTSVLAAYGRIVERAREPLFYLDWGVPDTLDGRFEVLALHAFLVLNRLKGEPGAADFAQELFDTMFADLDRGLREMGASDIGVGRHVKAMASGFYGRVVAYEAGLAGDDAVLMAALRRNLFGSTEGDASGVAALDGVLAGAARYLRRQAAALATEPLPALLAGEVRFAGFEA
jgi:cytochrome b pre-mRNA-processing protein 3